MAHISGKIRSEKTTTVKLSTYSAIRLYHGRPKSNNKSGIMGVPGFSSHMSSIEQAIRNDDPYADHHFMIIEKAIDDLRVDFENTYTEIDDFVKKNTKGMDLKKSVSTDPSIAPVKLASRMGYKLLFQVMKADETVLKVLQANHIGLLSNEKKFKTIAHIERAVRSVVHLVFSYKFTGVTRDDIAANNQKAIKARGLMGELEQEILKGEKRSAEAPALPKKHNSQINSITQNDVAGEVVSKEKPGVKNDEIIELVEEVA